VPRDDEKEQLRPGPISGALEEWIPGLIAGGNGVRTKLATQVARELDSGAVPGHALWRAVNSSSALLRQIEAEKAPNGELDVRRLLAVVARWTRTHRTRSRWPRSRRSTGRCRAPARRRLPGRLPRRAHDANQGRRPDHHRRPLGRGGAASLHVPPDDAPGGARGNTPKRGRPGSDRPR
jgi:hypothetical protein